MIKPWGSAKGPHGSFWNQGERAAGFKLSEFPARTPEGQAQ